MSLADLKMIPPVQGLSQQDERSELQSRRLEDWADGVCQRHVPLRSANDISVVLWELKGGECLGPLTDFISIRRENATRTRSLNTAIDPW